MKICRSRQRGVALAMILWILAALALMTASIMYTARTDVELTQLYLAKVKARAVSRGVAHLLMGELIKTQAEGGYDGTAPFRREYELEDVSVVATAIPASGYININTAPEALINDLLLYNADIAEETAAELARNIIDWRGAPEETVESSPRPFEVVEDLLQVSGMTRQIYDGIFTAVSVIEGGAVGVSVGSAPENVLGVLLKGDRDAAESIVMSRADTPSGAAPADIAVESPFVMTPLSGSSYCLVIRVESADEFLVEQRIWTQATPGTAGLPWKILRAMPLGVRKKADEEGQPHAG